MPSGRGSSSSVRSVWSSYIGVLLRGNAERVENRHRRTFLLFQQAKQQMFGSWW
jgi:hypothetical protein